MWESIKKFFGFGKTEVVTELPKKEKAPKAKPELKEESKVVTAKEIKAKVKKEATKTEKSEEKRPSKPSKPRKPKSKE